MFTRLGLGCCVALIAFASTAHATSIDFSHDGSGFSVVGPGGFVLETELDFFGTGTHELFNVGFSFTTGQAASFTVDDSGASHYLFTDGVLSFTHEGKTSMLAVLPFTFELSALEYDPVWGGDGPVALMPGVLDLTIDSGRLRTPLAKALGVKRAVSGGTFSFVVDDFRGDPFADERDGVPSYLAGSVDVKDKIKPPKEPKEPKHPKAGPRAAAAADVAAVPEPSSLALMGVALAFAARRFRRRDS